MTDDKTIIDIMGVALDEFVATQRQAIKALRPFAKMGQALWENKQHSFTCPERVVMKHGDITLTLNQFYDAWDIIKKQQPKGTDENKN